MTHHKGTSLTQQGREEGIRRLMSINLLKRLESSVYSFRLTIDRIKMLIDSTIGTIDRYQSGNLVLDLTEITDIEDFDYDDQNTDYFSVGKKVKIDLADMDYVSWKRELEKDAENLELLSLMIADITPEHDTKLQTLLDLIRKKIEHPINPAIGRSSSSPLFPTRRIISTRMSASLPKRNSVWKRLKSPAQWMARRPFQSSAPTSIPC